MTLGELQDKAGCPYPRGSRRALAEALTALAREVDSVIEDIQERPMVDLVRLTRGLGAILLGAARVATVGGVSLSTAARLVLVRESA